MELKPVFLAHCAPLAYWCPSCISTGCLREPGRKLGANVISLTSESAVVLPKPKQTLLPLLVVLFLISYGLMAMLVVEQGRTIDSQRTLIRQLVSDSSELSQMKGKAAMDQYAATHPKQKAPAQVQPQQQAPAAPATPQASDKNTNGTAKFRKPLPQRPSQEGQEMADERRSSKSI